MVSDPVVFLYATMYIVVRSLIIIIIIIIIIMMIMMIMQCFAKCTSVDSPDPAGSRHNLV